ncbi:MAG: HNH endonuclease domain-containing protein [Candidatus Cryptobacteroides sp.]
MQFTDEIKKRVWEKARKEPGYDENIVRKDACGAWIMWDKYGMRDNVFGWEIDHIYPLAKGGDDASLNLRALHCLNNISKGDDYPSYVADVTSEGDTNIRKARNVTVNAALIEKLTKLYKDN